MIQNLSAAQLHKAAKLRGQIDALQAELNRLIGSSGLKGGAVKATGKRKLSAAARKRIVEAQKARWAKFHASKK